MALKTAVVDTKSFKASMKEIAKIFGAPALAGKVTTLALAILAESQNSPVPRDTGALAESATVQPGEKPSEVVFGFNRAYASAQDLGTTKLPPKHYGSDVGPNFYFSETVRRSGPKAFETMTRLLKADLARLDKKIKAIEGKKRK